MMQSTTITFFLTALLLSSCSVFKKRMNVQELSNQAVFEYFNHVTYTFGDITLFTGKGPVQIAPLLTLRDTLRLNGKAYFGAMAGSESIKLPVSKKSYPLIIPDSLAAKFRYLGDSMDYERDYAMIYLFSPLLPTDSANVFMMQYDVWSSYCSDGDCTRYLLRELVKFRLEHGKVCYVEEVSQPNGLVNLCTFGNFSQKEMENALPGEKIKKGPYNWTAPPTKN